MKNAMFVLVMAVLVAVPSWGSFQHDQTGHQSGNPNMSMMQNCPMNLQGAVIAVSDTDNGIVLTITTQSGDVAELRRRTETMAKMHSAPDKASMHGEMVAFSAKYEEIANGARLILTPKDPALLDTFRDKVRQHAEQMKKGECSMMQRMMPGMMNGMKESDPAPKAEPKRKPEEEDHSGHHPPGEKK
jgi:hypothetical protein